jgi:4-hydroxybenzoate polyprenyltransferase/phosphoserine phosphatase
MDGYWSVRAERGRCLLEWVLDAAGCRTAGMLQVSTNPPLVLDLDGTLLRSDLLLESAWAHVGADPLRLFGLLRDLTRGKAALKASIARDTSLDVAHLPYDERVIALAREARDAGRPVWLVSASNERYVGAVADHLGLFDGWIASTDAQNLSAEAKARRLVEEFGERGFDYVGNSRADLPVWAVARRSTAVRPSASVRRRLAAIDPAATVLEPSSTSLDAWIKLIRVHQWAKNLLVLVPVVTAHRFDAVALAQALAAFLLFSIAASSVYIVNDLVDLDADRKHPSKRRRPLAAGTVPIAAATILAPTLLLLALLSALLLSPVFAAVLLGYLVLTTAYTFVLKRKMLVDVVTLATLYTLRVIAGAAAIAVPVSEWLLAFSMFMFTALALLKRYVELAGRANGNAEASNRNYRKSDLDVVAALAAAAGFNAVTVFALYISSDTVKALYRHPQALWLACPILMYWIGRALMIAHRGLMHDDPIVFALKDWNSLVAFGLIAAIALLAM